jgi:hypothetical protein
VGPVGPVEPVIPIILVSSVTSPLHINVFGASAGPVVPFPLPTYKYNNPPRIITKSPIRIVVERGLPFKSGRGINVKLPVFQR